MKTYKGFNKNMTVKNGYKYEEGKEYEEEKAVACECGFHACEYPLDCFRYYSPESSVYHVVEQSGEFSKDSDDSKVASTKMIRVDGDKIKADTWYMMENGEVVEVEEE